jgi:adenylate kinase
MRLLIIGPQGSGTGTQAKLLSEELESPHISTGDLCRNAKGSLRKEVNEYLVSGRLVPDELTFKLLKQRLDKRDCEGGFVLDGCPRNLRQVELLKQITEIDRAILINISEQTAIDRMSNRLTCKVCNEVFNKLTMPPKKEGKCDYCLGELIQRADDKPEAIKKRLNIYHQETEPIVAVYREQKKLLEVNGEQDPEKIKQEILRVLK